MTRTGVRHQLNARKRRGLATVYRLVLQHLNEMEISLTREQVAEFEEAVVWLRENTKEQRETQ